MSPLTHEQYRRVWAASDGPYLDMLEELLLAGDRREGRNGVTYSLFGRQIVFDLAKGFPLLTTKKVHLKSVIAELLWFLSGSTNAKVLEDQGVNIWREWADEDGELGPIYGYQWRRWHDGEFPNRPIDQIAQVIEGLKADPYGRRHVVTAWNPVDIPEMALPPCHCLFQFHVSNDGRLNCQLYQRSADVFLGVPFNIASYALLTMMVAKVIGRQPGRFIHTFGDYHLYADHEAQALEQLSRVPRPFPTMTLANRDTIDGWTLGDFTLMGYDPHPAIKAPVSA